MSLEMAHKVILPPQKNYIPQFLKQRDINSYYICVLELNFETTNGLGEPSFKLVVPYFAAGFGKNYSEVMLTLPFLSLLARPLITTEFWITLRDCEI
jgi:hypothetical protein